MINICNLLQYWYTSTVKDEAYIGVWESKAGITCSDRTEACENKEIIAKRKLRSK